MRLFLLGTLVLPFAAAAAQTPSAARLDSICGDYRGTDRPGCAVAVVGVVS